MNRMMTQRLLTFSPFRRLAWFLADRGIMREAVEEAFRRRLVDAAPVTGAARDPEPERRAVSEASSAAG